MLDILLLRFDAPLISFGGPAVDQHNVTAEFPARSQIAGMMANALGYDHRDDVRLASLQSRLRLAVRQDQAGQRIVDFQTVDLGQRFLCDTAWTTRGRIEERAGASGEGTHIRYRHFLADALYTLAVTLSEPDIEPTLDRVAEALASPVRPLYIGRKCCIPSVPVLIGKTREQSLLDALCKVPPAGRPRQPEAARTMKAWWPEDEGERPHSRLVTVTDERDWLNRIHVGRRFVREGTIVVEVAHA